jgi:hypothetical protein
MRQATSVLNLEDRQHIDTLKAIATADLNPDLRRVEVYILGAGKTIPLPLRLQFEKLLPCQPGLAIHIAPKRLLHFRQEMLEVLADRCYLRHGCKSLFENGFCLLGKKPTYTLSLFAQGNLHHPPNFLLDSQHYYAYYSARLTYNLVKTP